MLILDHTRFLVPKIAMMLFAIVSINGYAQTNPDLPDASILTEKYLEEISKREVGQSAFAFKVDNYRMRPMRSAGMANARTATPNAAEDREVQESDVFKLGKKGEKELFLLNRYRGFQVISFKGGIDKPTIEGRFPIFNKYNSEMYYLPKKDLVLVINTEWGYRFWGNNQGAHQTVMYVLNVADTKKPFLVSEKKIPGYLAKSRMVGDVLYVITHEGGYRNQTHKMTSLKLTADYSINTIKSVALNTENRYTRTMNAVKVGQKYYVMATSTNWRSEGDHVNLFDITSSKGEIKKVLTAKAKGRINERSQTFIKNDHLFMVSNYRTTNNGRRGIARIAVEAVAIKASSTIVSADKERTITIGDTNGLSASLQDVRVSDNLLYTFWVPVNRIDPFDLFDISNPSVGIKHLGQLQFPGWISKAFPLTYKGEKYVIGLGTIVPAVNNENNRRFPQAKLFKIEKNGSTYSHKEISTVSLKESNVWANLNAQDKLFDFISLGEGKFQILFPAYFGNARKSGAQIVNLDMNSATLSEGVKVVGEQSWLKRVFSNKELLTINTFSDQQLATFNQDSSSSNFANAVSILELARNIIDFQQVSSTTGIQIIKDDQKSVELREVSLDKIDAEKNEVLKSLTLKGSYYWHNVSDDKIQVVLAKHKEKEITSGVGTRRPYTYTQKVVESLELVTVDKETMKITTSNLIMMNNNDVNVYQRLETHKLDSAHLLKLGKMYFTVSDEVLKSASIAKSCQYFMNEKTGYFSLQAVGNELHAFNAFKVKTTSTDIRTGGVSTTRRPVRPMPIRGEDYYMGFMKKVSLNGKVINCSESMNVPGQTLTYSNTHLVASDAVKRGYWHWGIRYSYQDPSFGMRRPRPGYNRSEKTFALKVVDKTATITGVLKKDLSHSVLNGMLVTFKSTNNEHQLDFWSVADGGYFVSRPHFFTTSGSDSMSLITIKKANDRNLAFFKKGNLVDVYEIGSAGAMKKLDVSTSFDQNKEDGSAEYIFNISKITVLDDNQIAISQGLYGLELLTIN